MAMRAARLLMIPFALAALAAAPAANKAPAKPVAPAAFDAQNPQGFMDLLSETGARAQTARREEDAVFVTVTSAAAAFSMQFAGCTTQGRTCRAVLLDHTLARGAVSPAQVNAFNQTSVMCRLYQDRAGFNHVTYSSLLFRSDTRQDAAVHLQAWQGCIADGREFVKDPVAYLANAA